MLSKKIEGRVNVVNPDNLHIGDKGVTVSRCAPMGKAIFKEKFYEVSALAEFIDENVVIKVVKISGKKIFVKHKIIISKIFYQKKQCPSPPTSRNETHFN